MVTMPQHQTTFDYAKYGFRDEGTARRSSNRAVGAAFRPCFPGDALVDANAPPIPA